MVQILFGLFLVVVQPPTPATVGEFIGQKAAAIAQPSEAPVPVPFMTSATVAERAKALQLVIDGFWLSYKREPSKEFRAAVDVELKRIVDAWTVSDVQLALAPLTPENLNRAMTLVTRTNGRLEPKLVDIRAKLEFLKISADAPEAPIVAAPSEGAPPAP
jgi:hypothetical protein